MPRFSLILFSSWMATSPATRVEWQPRQHRRRCRHRALEQLRRRRSGGEQLLARYGSVGSVVHARGFTGYESRTVNAVFAVGDERLTTTTTVRGGAFDLDFLFAITDCNLGANSYAGGAFTIDVDGDGTCDPTVDRVFVWGASGGPPGTCRPIDVTPQSPACNLSTYGGNSDALAAAQAVCPAVGSCLALCSPPTSGAGGAPALCGGGAAGAPEGAGAPARRRRLWFPTRPYPLRPRAAVSATASGPQSRARG